VIFLGVGIGILASGLLIPLLLRLGVREAWLGIAIASLLLTALAWQAWPSNGAVDAGEAAHFSARSAAHAREIQALYVEYGLTAVGQVTHVLFLVDFIARGLGRGVEAGSHYWVAFGVGSVIGPICAGFVADRIGFRSALRLSLLAQAIAVFLPLLSTGVVALVISSATIGSFISGSVALTLGRARELTPGNSRDQAVAWGRCTAAFGIGQAISAYVYSALFANFGSIYLIIFAIGGMGFTLALMIDLLTGVRRADPDPGERP
jgi:predicted MFS family arabinose efflux permease